MSEILREGNMTAEVKDPAALFQAGTRSPIDIYDRADYDQAIERTTLGLYPIAGPESSTRIGVSGLIKLSLGDPNRRVMENLRTGMESGNSDIKVQRTVFSNLFEIRDKRNPGGILHAGIYGEGDVIIDNHTSYTGTNGRALEIVAPEIDTIDPEVFVRGVVRSFMYIVGKSYISGANSSLKRTFVFDGFKNSKRAPGSNEHRAPQSPSKKQGSEDQRIDPSIEFVTTRSDETKLSDVGGLPYVKEQLAEIATSFLHPEVMEKWGAKRPQGLILYGEPGTGKTMLANALAGEIGAEIMFIQGSDIYNMWLGESERKIKELFNRIKSLTSRTVVVFDEFDAIIGTSEEPGPGGGGHARNSVAGIFKQELNGLGDANPNVLLVATTNNMERIDPALVRSGRFDHKLYIPMPDDAGRSEIISIIVAKAMSNQSDDEQFNPYSDDLNIPELVRITDGMSGADISEIFRRISMKKAIHEARTGSSVPINQEDLVSVVDSFRKSS